MMTFDITFYFTDGTHKHIKIDRESYEKAKDDAYDAATYDMNHNVDVKSIYIYGPGGYCTWEDWTV